MFLVQTSVQMVAVTQSFLAQCCIAALLWLVKDNCICHLILDVCSDLNMATSTLNNHHNHIQHLLK